MKQHVFSNQNRIKLKINNNKTSRNTDTLEEKHNSKQPKGQRRNYKENKKIFQTAR